MTFDLTKVTRAISSFDLRTWDPEGVIFYGDTNPKDDWFMLVLRGAGPRLDDGCWHQVNNQEDSVILEVDGDEVLRLSQVSRPLAGTALPTMRIAVGGLLFPLTDLRLLLIPALDGCLRRDIWLNQPGNTAPFSHPPQGACNPEAQPGTFLPPGAHTVFSLQGEASSVSFCLDGLRVQGKELDVDQALSRSKNIWTHSCPRSLNNSTNTPH
uniref:Sex hormone binding globulin n=1 Tax=Vombatus ursinus TaxID=29139 RepID=A0A4X2K2J7_VOMUR